MNPDFKHFNKHERKLLNYLYNARIKMSTRAIALKWGMHWTTVQDNLNKLEEKGWVIKEELANKVLWQFNFEAYE